MCYKQKYTILLALIPGPREPPLTTMNKVLKPIIDEFQVNTHMHFGHVGCDDDVKADDRSTEMRRWRRDQHRWSGRVRPSSPAVKRFRHSGDEEGIGASVA